MSVFNFFRDLFGIRRNEQEKKEIPNYGLEDQWQRRDDFRNPIWQIGEDDDDYDGDGETDDFRQPGRRDFGFGHFNMYSDPLELARYFENQMDGMLKNFFGFGDESIISSSSPFFEGSENYFQNSLPGIESPKEGNLRDEVLKPGYKTLVPKNFEDSIKDKVDVDLDGKITSDELSKVWKDPGSFENADNRQRNNNPFFFKTFGQSISTKIIRKADGTVEQHRIVKDSEGNEETTITQTVGDKTRTVVIRKDKDGKKTESESIDSVIGSKNPNSLIPFIGINDGNRRIDENPLQDFPWYKFFSPNPKL